MKIGIVGLGLIGTSVAMAARRAWPEAEIVGVDRAERLADRSIGATFARTSLDPRDLNASDVLVLATPVNATVDLVQQLADYLRPHRLVLDTGSTKRAIVRAARDARLPNFVGGHPMAGAESPGPGAARAELFEDRLWFLVGDQASASFEEAHRFVEALGSRPVAMGDDGSEHDQAMAAVSHLPQVVASALMACVGEAASGHLQFAGTGLRDTTRLAASSAAVWESVLASNADLLRPLLVELADDLRAIAGQLGNPEAVGRLFESANRWKKIAG